MTDWVERFITNTAFCRYPAFTDKMRSIKTSDGADEGKPPATPEATYPIFPHAHAELAAVVYERKPFGLLLPSPLTKAAPSCAAKTRSTSWASHSSIRRAVSSRMVAVAAGIA